MEKEQAVRLSRDVGFTREGVFPVSELRFLPEVRDACRMNKCGRYDRSWSCPPACGTLEECAAAAQRYAWGILLQTTVQMEDSFDVEAMMEGERLQKERLDAFCRSVEGEKHLALGVGSCTVCGKCTYPDAPCRFPEKMRPSMEAFGLLVTDVCKLTGLPYYYGTGTLTYTSCVLF